MKEVVKIVVFVPESHADRVREALAKAGAGFVGNYSHTSFSTKGVGRFLPRPGAHPSVGAVGKLEEVKEERIETVCHKEELEKIIKAVKAAHPYEEMALDVYPLVSNPQETSTQK